MLLVGAEGQLGWELGRLLPRIAPVATPSRDELDLARPDTIVSALESYRPSLVVNAGAFTNVEAAEVERERAMTVNGHAPGVLAEACERFGAALVHYSTDYVFDGRRTTPYRESDATHPLNWYGETKLAGEKAVLSAAVPALILRTSAVYSTRRPCFLATVRRIASQTGRLRIVDDQVTSPTWSRHLAQATVRMLAPGVGGLRRFVTDRRGVYNVSNRGGASWYELAAAILCHDEAIENRRDVELQAISSADYETRANRPAYSVLDGERLRARFGLRLASWESALREALGSNSG